MRETFRAVYAEIKRGERGVIGGARGSVTTSLPGESGVVGPGFGGRRPGGGGRVLVCLRMALSTDRKIACSRGVSFARDRFKNEEVAAVLQRAGLDRLSSSLDRIAAGIGDSAMRNSRFGPTRVLLHKPRLVVIDEALDPLDDDARNRVLSSLMTNSRTQLSSISAAPRPRATSLRAFCIWSKIPRAGASCPISESPN